MYSALDLARMFNTTKVTIYKKLKDKSLLEFIKETDNGKKLMQEGLNQFQLLMSESKVSYKVTNKQKKINLSFTSTDNNDYQDNYEKIDSNFTKVNNDYIENLKEQIDYLKKDRERLLNQLEKKDEIIEKQILLAEHSQKILTDSQEKLLLLEQKKEKTNIFKRIFSGKK